MPEIGGRFLNFPAGDCVWCGRPAMETAYTPGRGAGTEVPLHPIPCGVQIIRAYRAWVAGTPYRSDLIGQRAARLWGPPQNMLDSGPTVP